MAEVRIELGQVVSKPQLHKLLAGVFRFPDYYGQNWDSFDECIRDCGPTDGQIIVFGWESLNQRLPRDAELLQQCLADFSVDRSDVSLVWG